MWPHFYRPGSSLSSFVWVRHHPQPGCPGNQGAAHVELFRCRALLQASMMRCVSAATGIEFLKRELDCADARGPPGLSRATEESVVPLRHGDIRYVAARCWERVKDC